MLVKWVSKKQTKKTHQKTSVYVVCTNFHGVNILTTADFQITSLEQLGYKIPEYLMVSIQETVLAVSAHLCFYAFALHGSWLLVFRI